MSSVERIKELVQDQEYELSLEWEPAHRESTKKETRDLLSKCIESNHTNDIENAVATVAAGIIPFSSAAKIMKRSFKDLLLDHYDLLETALRDDSLLQVACELKVHVGFLDPILRRDNAVHINTTNSFLDWSHCSDARGPEQMWRRDNYKEVKSMESNGNTATKKTSLNFIRIADAAKTGMKGIIRPLLLKKVPPYFFEFEVVKWVVMFKWLKIWKRKFLSQALEYGGFLICFTVYAALISTTAKLSKASLALKVESSCLLSVTVLFALRMTLEEVRQMCTYMREGKEYFKGRLVGLRYFLKFRWNLIDLFSCSLLLVFVPLCHVLAMLDDGFDHALSLLIAVEAIVAFGKVSPRSMTKTQAQVFSADLVLCSAISPIWIAGSDGGRCGERLRCFSCTGIGYLAWLRSSPSSSLPTHHSC